jgi:cell division septation protein DedD
MSDQYEDEEYYGEEQDYAEEDESYEDEEDEAPAPAGKPKSNIVRTALFGVAGMLALTGIAYFAASWLAPDTLNDVVNNLPFVSHEEMASNPEGELPPPGGDADAAKMGKGGSEAVAPGTDVAAVPPDPAKAGAMKPGKPKSGEDDGGQEAGTEGMPPDQGSMKPNKPRRLPKPAPVANGAPMEGMPMEGTPVAKPIPQKPRGGTVTPKAWHSKANAARMAAARADWLRRHPPKVAPAAVSKGRFLGYGTRVVWVNGRRRVVRAPMYAVVHHPAPTGRLPLARHSSMAALPHSWKRAPKGYVVQIGSFANSSNASQLVSQLRMQGIRAYAAPSARGARVVIGSYPSRQAAAVKMQQLQAQGVPAAVTIN